MMIGFLREVHCDPGGGLQFYIKVWSSGVFPVVRTSYHTLDKGFSFLFCHSS